jgi:hypothetical protein
LQKPNTWAAAAKGAILKTVNLGTNLFDIEVIINKEGRPIYFGYSIGIFLSALFAIAIAIKKILNTECYIFSKCECLLDLMIIFNYARIFEGLYGQRN